MPGSNLFNDYMRGVGMHGTIAEKIITYGGVGLVLLLLVSGIRQIINSCAEVTNMQELRKAAITFDDEDDFDSKNNYRGVSKYTLNIKKED